MYGFFDSINFAYGNARVRASKSSILYKDDLLALTGQGYKDILFFLENKHYPEILNLVNSDFREELVQKLVKEQWFANIKKLISYLPKKYVPFFKSLLIKEDLEVMVNILRSKVNPYSSRHTLNTIVFESNFFDFNNLEKINDMTLDEYISFIKKTFVGEIAKKFESELNEGNLSNFENELRVFYFNRLKKFSKIDIVLVRYVKLLIDKENIRSALNKDVKGFVKGSLIDSNLFQTLVDAKTNDDFVSGLKDLPVKEYIQSQEKKSDIIKSLDRFEFDFSKKLFAQDGLTINPFVAYFIQKNIERKNVQILLKLKHARFDSKVIDEALI